MEFLRCVLEMNLEDNRKYIIVVFEKELESKKIEV